MSRILHIGQPPIAVALKSSSRAKRLSLRISGIDGKVSLTLPKRAALRDAKAFLNTKEGWIRQHLQAQPTQIDVRPGACLPIEGTPRTIALTQSARLRLEADHLYLPQRHAKTAAVVIRAFLKERARQRLTASSQRYAAQIGRSFAKLTLRDTRSRWGSCSCQGNLMYSWRLILAPPDILDYVAAHEVAHLAEMNHSAAFWAVVETLMPDYAPRRQWLRNHGRELHLFRF